MAVSAMSEHAFPVMAGRDPAICARTQMQPSGGGTDWGRVAGSSPAITGGAAPASPNDPAELGHSLSVMAGRDPAIYARTLMQPIGGGTDWGRVAGASPATPRGRGGRP